MPAWGGRVRIDRRRQALGGHSLGGLFTLRVLMERPQAFQTYLALSPSIWWDHASMVNDIANRIAGTEFGCTRIYLGVGELEEFATPVYAKESEALIRRMLMKTPALLNGRAIEAYLADMDAFTSASRMVSNAQQAARLLAPSVAEVRCDVFPD